MNPGGFYINKQEAMSGKGGDMEYLVIEEGGGGYGDKRWAYYA